MDYKSFSISRLTTLAPNNKTLVSRVSPSDIIFGAVLSPILFLFYSFVLGILLVNRRAFHNPYYRLTIGLGLCHLAMLTRYFYTFWVAFTGEYIFGPFFDTVMATLAWSVGWHSVITYHVIICFNRFVAIMFYDRTNGTTNNNGRSKASWSVFSSMSVSSNSGHLCLKPTASRVNLYNHQSIKNRRRAFIKEVKLMSEGFLVALTLVGQEVTFYFGSNPLLTLGVMLAHAGMSPFIYLILDKKLRKYFLARLIFVNKVRKFILRGQGSTDEDDPAAAAGEAGAPTELDIATVIDKKHIKDVIKLNTTVKQSSSNSADQIDDV